MIIDKFPEEKEGKKFDEGKPDHSMIEKSFIDAISKVMMHGEKKYGRDNWKKGLDYNRLFAATIRHMYQDKDESILDKDSGLEHLAHAACNLMFIIWERKQAEKIGTD